MDPVLLRDRINCGLMPLVNKVDCLDAIRQQARYVMAWQTVMARVVASGLKRNLHQPLEAKGKVVDCATVIPTRWTVVDLEPKSMNGGCNVVNVHLTCSGLNCPRRMCHT